MGGFSLLGQLAGGYAQAAERDRQRQFETETQNRQNALGMVKILLDNPAVPPEYKGALVQHGLDIVHTPYGKKLPSTDKMLQSLPQIGTPAQTQQAPVPPVQLSMPATPPAPQGIGTGAAQGAPSLTQGASAANGGAFPSIGPKGTMPAVAPPPLPPGSPIPAGPTLPGGSQSVTLAASPNYTPAGQFHFMSAQEQAQQQALAANTMMQTQIQGLRDQGFSDEQIATKLGMSKLVGIPFGGLYNTGTGETVSPTNVPMTKVQYTVDGKGPFFGFTSRAGGPILDPAGNPVPGAQPFTPSTLPTTKTSEFHYVDENGNVHAVPTTTVTRKGLPGGQGGKPTAAAAPGVAPPPQPSGAGGAAAPKPAAPAAAAGGGGGRIISGNSPKLSPQLVRTDKSYKDISGQLDKIQSPIDQLAARMSRLEDTLAQNTPQADALVAPELLTVMAGGQGSGLRMNEAEIARIVGGRSKWETLKASVNKWKLDPEAARSITPEQQKQIQDLVTTVRSKIDQKRALFEQGRTDLLNAKSPEEHRAIYNRIRNDALAIDTGTYQTPSAGAGARAGAGAGAAATSHLIELNGKQYRYNGSGPTDDIKSYTEVKTQ